MTELGETIPDEEGAEIEYCPRSLETGGGPNSVMKPGFDGRMVWRGDLTCSWCGSLHPKLFMERLHEQTIKLIPTDKNYKVYVENHGGEPFVGVRPKFYFQHLDDRQKNDFVDLLNAQKVLLGYPGRFYVPPFFCKFRPPNEQEH